MYIETIGTRDIAIRDDGKITFKHRMPVDCPTYGEALQQRNRHFMLKRYPNDNLIKKLIMRTPSKHGVMQITNLLRSDQSKKKKKL